MGTIPAVEDNSSLLGGQATILASSSRADRAAVLCVQGHPVPLTGFIVQLLQ